MSLPNEETIGRIRGQTDLGCRLDQRGAPCILSQQVCVFNVSADPCELNNLAFKYPSLIKMLESTLDAYKATALKPGNKPIDPRADPKFWK